MMTECDEPDCVSTLRELDRFLELARIRHRLCQRGMPTRVVGTKGDGFLSLFDGLIMLPLVEMNTPQ